MTQETTHYAELELYSPPADVIRPAFAYNNIPVFFGCDDKFLPHSMTAIASLLEHASADNNYDLFIVQNGIPESRMVEAAKWVRRYPNATLRFVDIGPTLDRIGRSSFNTTREYSLAVFFRVFGPGIFRDYDKIVYLDSDILLLGDVAELFNTDLEGKLVGACHDFVMEQQSMDNPKTGAFWREQLRMEPGSDGYFFSGTLLMDLERMRACGFEAAMLERLGSIKGSKLPDQDLLNSVLHDDVKFVGCEWSCLDWMYDPQEKSRNFQLMSDDARQQVRASLDRTKVLHYAERKPWTPDYMGEHASYYWQYAQMTPFYRETASRLKAECVPGRLFVRRLILDLQTLNFRWRSALADSDKKAKYDSRLHNLRLRREGLERQARLSGTFRAVNGNFSAVVIETPGSSITIVDLDARGV